MYKGQLIRVKAYRVMIYVAAVVLVLLAVLLSIARVMLDDLGKYRDVIEQQVSELLDQKVRIQGFDARLEGITPVLIFKDVKLLHSKSDKVLTRFSEARIGLAILASIRERQLVPGEITINGINIIVTRRKSGVLSVEGLKVSQIEGREQVAADTQLAQWLFTYSDLSLENSSIVWQDKIKEKRYQFNDVNLHLTNRGRRHILAGQMEVPQKLGRNVKFSADIDGDSLNPQDWQGTFFLQAFSVDIGEWEQFRPQWNKTRLKGGYLDVRLWGAWKQNSLVSLSGDLSMYDLILKKSKKSHELKLIAGMFDWQRGTQDWSLKLKDFQLIHQGSVWPKTDLSIFYQAGKEDVYQVSADYLRIEDIHDFGNMLAEGPDDLRKTLDNLNPSGDIRAVKAKVFIKDKSLRDFAIKAQFNNVNTAAWQSYPAIQGFKGELSSTLNYGKLEIDNQFSTLYFPKLFRQAFSLHQLTANIAWQRNHMGWQLLSNNVIAHTSAVKSHANVYLQLPSNQASPYMDLQVQFWDGDASQAGTYYPVGIMGKKLVQWLDQGIVAGDVSFGGAVFNGRLRDFPFKQKQGNFQVQFYADNVELNYQNNWPPLTKARVDASFTGDGMQINGIHAQLLKQTTSQQVDVAIKDFLNPEIQLHTKISGPTKEVFEFLVNSPIAPEARDFVNSVEMSGPSKLNLELYIPLNKKIAAIKPLHYRGDVKLQGSSFMLLDKKVDIRGVEGSLGFDEAGLNAKGIKASIMGEPAVLDVYTQDFKDARPIQIVGSGKLKTEKLVKRFDIPGLAQLSGKTAWQGVLTLPYKGQGQPIPARLSLTSNLKNVHITLPKPFNKLAEAEAAFGMTVEFPKNDVTKMTLQFKDELGVSLGLAQQDGIIDVVKGAMHFGENIPDLPQTNLLRLEGSSAELPVKEWINVFSNNKGKSHHDWKTMPVELAMERLQLQIEVDEKKPASSSAIAILPQQWPILNGYINNLVINDSMIGKVELGVERERNGFRIRQLDLTTPYSKVTGDGGWYYRRQHETHLNLKMTSKDLGSQLAKWGFAAIIKGGKVKNSQAKVDWSNSPFGFEFAKLKGTMDAYIEDGNIVEVNPGAGRLFGLLSLSALPRRLFLDFADMKSGFSFDTVQGRFDMRDGNAITKNLAVDSTLAKIVVDGRTGLSQQDYDLDVLVIPNISGTAPLPAWALWGPQVGAVMLFFKSLFGSAFDKSVASRYRITGSWEKPVIEKVVADGGDSKE